MTMQRSMRRAKFLLALIISGLSLSATGATAAGFLDNFDSVTPIALANDPQVNVGAVSPYFLNQAQGNGIITNCTTGVGCAYYSGNAITNDAGGHGNFLFENTAGADGPPGQNLFYASNSFAVAQNTAYTFSFAVANATSCCYGVIDSAIHGNNSVVASFAPVTTNGPLFDQSGHTVWTVYSFSWNSGTSNQATISLSNRNLGGFGNDFGVDNISLSETVGSVPEPTAWALMIGGFGMAGAALRRRRSLAEA